VLETLCEGPADAGPEALQPIRPWSSVARRGRAVLNHSFQATTARAILPEIAGVPLVREPVFVIVVQVFVAWLISWRLRSIDLFLKRLHDSFLNHFAAFGIDRMRDVGIKFGAALIVLGQLFVLHSVPALVAVARPQVILEAAFRAAHRELAAGHGHEGPIRALNDLQVSDDKGVIERDGAERL